MYERRKIFAAAGAAMLMLKGTAIPAAAEEKQTDQISLMCLGDSITDGFWLPGGYRNTLCSRITENGQEARVNFVGPNWGGSGYDPQHAGYSGYSIDNIAQADSISGQRTGISSFADWLMETFPADVVFLQLGTNDILSLYDLGHFGERLEGLVDVILDALPENGALYLATLPCMDATNTLYISEYFFTVESMDEAVENCNAQIRALAKKKQDAGKPVILANINGVLTKEDLYDGVHPNEEGYRKMGDFWYKRLCEYLNGEAFTAQNTETAVTETTAPPVPAPEGDVTLDGKVNSADAVALAKILTGDAEASEESAMQADLDGNRKLNAVDLTLLIRSL